MKVEWVGTRGRPKSRWSDCVTKDMKKKNPEGTNAREIHAKLAALLRWVEMSISLVLEGVSRSSHR